MCDSVYFMFWCSSYPAVFLYAVKQLAVIFTTFTSLHVVFTLFGPPPPPQVKIRDQSLAGFACGL